MADTTFDAVIIGAVRKAKRGRSSHPRREDDFGGGKPLPRGTVHVLRYDSFDGARESFVALPGDHRRDVCA